MVKDVGKKAKVSRRLERDRAFLIAGRCISSVALWLFVKLASSILVESSIPDMLRSCAISVSIAMREGPSLPIPLPAPFVKWRLRQLFPYLQFLNLRYQ